MNFNKKIIIATSLFTTLFLASCYGTGNSGNNSSNGGSGTTSNVEQSVPVDQQLKTAASAYASVSSNTTTSSLKSGALAVNSCIQVFCIQVLPMSSSNVAFVSNQWYSTATIAFAVKNTCTTSQSLSDFDVSISGVSLNKSTTPLTVGSVSQSGQGPWSNVTTTSSGSNIDVLISTPACDGSYCDWANLPAGATRSFVLNGSYSGAITSLSVASIAAGSGGGSGTVTPTPPVTVTTSPTPPATTGSLVVKFVTSPSLTTACSSAASCVVSLKVIDPSTTKVVGSNTVDLKTAPAYSMTLNTLLQGNYTVSVDASGLPAGYSYVTNPSSGSAGVVNGSTTTATVSFDYTKVPVSTTSLVLSANYPTGSAASFTNTSSIDVKVLDVTANQVYQVTIPFGSTTTLSNLPVSDKYTIVSQGIANAATGLYYNGYYESNVTLAKSGATRAIALVKSTRTTFTAPVNVTGLGSSVAMPTMSLADNNNVTIATINTFTTFYKYEPVVLVAGKAYTFVTGDTVTVNLSNPAGYKLSSVSPTVVSSPISEITATYVVDSSTGTVAGWPNYVAMGAIGGPNIDPTATTGTGDDAFGGKPVDAVFKYAGVNGDGDPGVIDPPMNVLRMTQDLTNVSKVNDRASRVVIVEYTAQMSGGQNIDDFTNTAVGVSDKQGATYIMARHFITLSADALALANNPVVKDGKSYYGSLIMNPDFLGAIEQNGYIDQVNAALPSGAVNTAVDQALCLMTTSRTYTNTFMPNGDNNQVYKNKTYSGTPYQILAGLVNDGYPVWSLSSHTDKFWNTGINNKDDDGSYSQVGTWFNSCVANPTYDTTKYARPNFASGLEGWIQANNWLIRTFAPKSSGVTFGWQDNMWAVNSGFWLHNNLTTDQIATEYSTPVSNFLKTNAPSSISNANGFRPDYFVFDRYEMDDSAAPGSATLYNATSWDNFIVAVGKVSKDFSNIPVMLWQIPGSHLSNTTETTPELYNSTAGLYVFSTAPVYFFGDSNLKSDLSNMIKGSDTSSTNSAVGNYIVANTYLTCPSCDYIKYLKTYQGQANNYDWSKDNGRLAFAVANNVFSIMWGGGNTTNVIKNFSNTTDHGWLANKIIQYYKSPVAVK